MQALVRVYYGVDPDTLSWEDLLVHHADALCVMQLQANLIATKTIQRLAEALNKD